MKRSPGGDDDIDPSTPPYSIITTNIVSKGACMMDIPKTVALPMNMDEHGTIRVSGTRVTLDTIIARYHQGDR